jgi:hypothetical protein
MDQTQRPFRAFTRRAIIAGALATVVGTAGRLGRDGTTVRGAADSSTVARTAPIGRLTDRPDGLTPSQGGSTVGFVRRSRLPRGGRTLFPRYRLVGYSGFPGSPALGRLGVGDLSARVTEIEDLAAHYAQGRIGLPVLELIAVVVQQHPGRDGRFRVRVADEVIADHLAVARQHRALVLLNIQPGRSSFEEEVAALSGWLREPEVGLALDPEWAVGPGQIPGRVFGHTTGAELDRVAERVSRLVRQNDLPEKALVVHQLAPGIITGWHQVRERPGVAVVKSVDGIGTPAQKTATWQRLTRQLPGTVHPGFKLFYSEDRAAGSPLMTPSQVLGLQPTPEYVLYE